jgi:hypothetical protein
VDDIGRAYVVHALSVGELEDGIVDAYYGPPELREVAIQRGATAADLIVEAQTLRQQVNAEVDDQQRARWLDRQLVGLETLSRRLDGEEMPYTEEVERCFDATPEATPPEIYTQVRQALGDLLPGGGSLHERIQARDSRLTVPPDRLAAILEWIVGELREMSSAVFPNPEGENLEVTLVTDEPWAAYNWYYGNLRSRIEFNVDLPTRANQLVFTLGHETFPGHHLEHASKEQRLYRELGRVEATVQLINTPEAYISEGLAEVGPRILVDAQKWQELLIAICEQAGIPMSAAGASDEWEISQALRLLRGSSGDAALQLHAGGRTREQVVQFLIDDVLRTREQAEKSMGFLTDPLWRTYSFCYAGGEQLLTRWIDQAPDKSAQIARFQRLLTEQIVPSGIDEELSAD